MSPNELLAGLLAGGKVRPVTYAEMAQVLRDAGYTFDGEERSYRYWKHPSHRRVLLLRDEGDKSMYGGYIDKAAKHLRAVNDAGGLP